MSDASDTCLGVACCDEPPYPVQPAVVSAAPTTYWNTQQTVSCPTGSTGASKTVSAHTYSSTVSQDDANNQAFLAALKQLACTVP